MATVISHAIVAGTLATVAPKNVGTGRLAIVLAVLAVLPDVDVLGFRMGIPYEHMLGHRGFTHSLMFALIVASVTASLFLRAVRPVGKDWWTLFLLAFVAMISHGVLDAFTDAGLGVGFLIPFDDTRFFAPWRPLATSPLSVAAFINGPGLRILLNELLWIGLPWAAFLGVLHLLRLAILRRTLP